MYRLIDKYICAYKVCLCVYLSGGSHGKESKEKTPPPPGAFWLSVESVVWLNKSNEKREKEEGKT